MGDLAQSVSHMQRSLTDTVTHVREGSDAIYAGTREIAAGNTDLSSRTEQQASALEETAASMEQLTATVKQMCIRDRYVRVVTSTVASI